VTPENTVEVEAFDVEVVDPTGTGDTRPLAGLSREAGRVAAAAAALNRTGDDARGGLATRAEVEELLS
jgi:ribokinase/sulfofructose kinase